MDALRRLPNTWVFKVHGGPYQAAGVPDVLVLRHGVLFGIELKRPGEVPTPLQQHQLDAIERAGGRTAIIFTTTPTSEVITWLVHSSARPAAETQSESMAVF